MNTELVTVKAEALRWVPNGFKFVRLGTTLVFVGIEDDFISCAPESRSEVWTYHIGGDYEIQVNATAYTAAVIERIKEMFDGKLVCVNKHKTSIVAVVLLGHAELRSLIPIKADPAPWQETGEWRAEE